MKTYKADISCCVTHSITSDDDNPANVPLAMAVILLSYRSLTNINCDFESLNCTDKYDLAEIEVYISLVGFSYLESTYRSNIHTKSNF